MDKVYSPAQIEQRLYERWERAGRFACGYFALRRARTALASSASSPRVSFQSMQASVML